MDPEDDRLVTLARAALSRAPGATEGAAVRDEIGRTYAAAAVSAGELRLSALEAAVAQAVASGVRRLEAAVLVGSDVDDRPTPRESSALSALGGPAVHLVGAPA